MVTPEDVVRLIFLGYWGAMLVLIIVVWLVVWKAIPNGRRLLVGVVVSVLVVEWFVRPVAKRAETTKQENKVQQEKYLAAKAVFDGYCQQAGIKIYRTVEDVEGVTLLNVWPREKRYEDQMWEYAGLPKAVGMDGYIQGFLYWRKWDFQIDDFNNYGNGIVLNPKYQHQNYQNEIEKRYKIVNSYQYVDVLENQTYQRYQFKDLYHLQEISVSPIKKPSRYTVEFDNPVIPQDRKIWIATTKATIKDSVTGEVLGESTWHSLHGGQGVKRYSTTGIWDRAIVCPAIADAQHEPIEYFTLKVLKPKQLNWQANAGTP